MIFEPRTQNQSLTNHKPINCVYYVQKDAIPIGQQSVICMWKESYSMHFFLIIFGTFGWVVRTSLHLFIHLGGRNNPLQLWNHNQNKKIANSIKQRMWILRYIKASIFPYSAWQKIYTINKINHVKLNVCLEEHNIFRSISHQNSFVWKEQQKSKSNFRFLKSNIGSNFVPESKTIVIKSPKKCLLPFYHRLRWCFHKQNGWCCLKSCWNEIFSWIIVHMTWHF